jgi:gamma-glutamylcyclotransferase (GGCT)/AIG2-like uncharacterized protein YtfP
MFGFRKFWRFQFWNIHETHALFISLTIVVMPDLIFVYGTLRSEFNNPYARLLRRQASLIGPAVLTGSIYRLRHYPAFRPEPAGKVRGEVYRLNQPVETLKALDEYEGDEYERVVVNDFWVYQYKKPLPESSRIPSGDFCAP